MMDLLASLPGIGLTLVKSLVELHDGAIEAWSEGIEHGSEFSVRLPLALQPQPIGTAGQPSGSATGGDFPAADPGG